MKKIVLFILLCSGANLLAQNTITPPSGQAIKINGLINLSSGINFISDTNSIRINGIRVWGTAGVRNILVGSEAGAVNTGADNLFFGHRAGYYNTTGYDNNFVGSLSGFNNTTGSENTFNGSASGFYNTTGNDNVGFGYMSGYSGISGTENAYFGNWSGSANTTGSKNTFIGYLAGATNVSGSGNVFIGCRAGRNELGSDKLYVSNTNTSSPLIYGDFAASQLVFNGKVGVGTSNFPTTNGGVDVSAYKMFVKGGILTEEIRVSTGWADYVFDKDYKLRSLSDLKTFIDTHRHLPNVPSEDEVSKNGLELGNISRIHQEKIEELTLYIIEQDQEIDKLNKELLELKEKVNRLIEK